MLILAETDISVSCVGKGQFIRWYLNGWHYLFLEQGSESQVVEGTEALPSSYSRLALQAYGLKEGDLGAAKTVAFAPSLDLLTVDGWKNAILESGSVETKRTGASLYPISLTVNVFGKVADYSPVAEVVPPLTDLDYLRLIRDANPTSQLPTLWLDSEDPYTQWEGARFNGDFVDQLSIYSRGINVMPNVNRLKKLLRLDCYYNAIPNLNLESMPSLLILVAHDNNIEEINLQGSGNIQAIRVENNFIQSLNLAGKRNLSIINASNNRLLYIDVQGASGITNFLIPHNRLASVPSLVARGAIVDYDFRYNNFPTAELNRFRAMGFTDESRLLPQNP